MKTRAIAAGLLLGLLAGCGTRGGIRAAPGASAAEIERALAASAERWNQGDLQGFLAPYLDSPATTFVTAEGLLRGKDAIEARYRRHYWRGGAPRQTLRFAELETRELGPDHALTTGRYLLFDPAGAQVAEGTFSLVLTRTSAGWKIVHDHSS